MNDLTKDFLKSELGNSFYEELYHLPNSNSTVVKDCKTGTLYVRKILKYYDIRVYEYLKTNTHINIPKIIDFNESDSVLTVYEEYINGVTLEEYMANHSKSEILKVVDSVCDALTFIHSAKTPIIHRDIKMSNIMISNDGVVKLIDYNAAKVVNSNSSKDTVLLGTEGYAAPEQYGFGSSDVRTDIYALGKLVQQLFGDEYSSVVKKAVQIDPDKRYKSVKAFKFALHHKGLEILPFPGFRSDDTFHKIASAVGYIFAIWIILGLSVEDYSKVATRLVQITFFVWLVLVVDMLSGVSPIFTRLPLTSSDNLFVRLLGYALYGVISFIIALIGPSMIVTFTGI